MAYCRFSEGDVYLVKTPRPDAEEWECFSCELDTDERDQFFSSLLEVREHLKAHEKAGHKVPVRAVSRVETELVEMFKENPTPENIEAAMQGFFNDDPYVYDLDFFFPCPFSDWEDRFLYTLESLDFAGIWKKRSHYYAFFNVADRFNDRERALRILVSWEKNTIALINRKSIDPEPAQKELSEEGRAEERLLKAIFGKPNAEEWLHEIRNATVKLRT